ncbi:MAG: hypothetical protein ACTJFR_05125 [Canibacter sp.]
MRDLALQGTAVLYTSHVLHEFEELDAEIAVLHNGRISAQGSIPQLLREHSQASVELRFKTAAPHLKGWQHLNQSTIVRSGRFSPGTALTEAVDALGEHDGRPEDLVDVKLRQPGLEDVFLALTGVSWSVSRPEPTASLPSSSAGRVTQ